MARPKDRDEQEALKLDECFKETLEGVRPYVSSLSVPEEIHLCRIWLDKLKRAISQRSLRNEYLFELCRHLKAGHVGGIFNEPPPNGRLEPFPRFCNHTIIESSSLSELTDSSSTVPYECSRKSSYRRKNKTISLYRSSDSNSSINENFIIAASPATRLCEKARAERNQSAVYRQKAQSFASIVKELQIQNERLKRDYSHFRENCECKENSVNLRATNDKLTAEITTLRTKLMEVQSMKELLEQSHRDIVEQYKSTMTEQINELDIRLREAQTKNVALDEKAVTANRRLEEIIRRKDEEVETMEQGYKKEVEDARRNSEAIVNEKNKELVAKNEIIRQKEIEIDEMDSKNKEAIALLDSKIQELEEKLEMKIEDETKMHSLLKEQCNTMKEEFTKMRADIEITTQTQNVKLLDEISMLKTAMKNLEKSKEKLNFECERKISQIRKKKDYEIKILRIHLQEQRTELATTLNSEKQFELDKVVDRLEERYKGVLAAADASAGNQRKNFLRKITNLENEILALKKSLVEQMEYV